MHKIIVTVGPSSISEDVLLKLREAGANSFRINLSHSNEESLTQYINILKKSGIRPSIDTQGSQLRIVKTKSKNVLKIGEKVIICFSKLQLDKKLDNNVEIIQLNHIEAYDQIEVDNIIRLDIDGLAVKVLNKDDAESCICEVISSGKAIENRAVDIIGKTLDLNVLTEFDKKAIKIAIKNGCKEVYASFISKAEDVKEVKKFLNPDMKLISKIETSLGVTNTLGIANQSDGILIDRGDLSREISIPLVPIATKKIIELCISVKKPVYLATNVLDSMMNAKIPSRAEVSDILNSLSQGVNGIVLAAEVAIGNNPVKSVALLKYLIDTYENHNKGLLGLSKVPLPSIHLVGAELINWL